MAHNVVDTSGSGGPVAFRTVLTLATPSTASTWSRVWALAIAAQALAMVAIACLTHQATAGELQGRAAGSDRAIVDACCAAYVRNLFKGD